MNYTQRVGVFSKLGYRLAQVSSEMPHLQEAYLYNNWFTIDMQIRAISAWASLLTEENLQNWLKPYQLAEPKEPKTVAIIMAGNIPLVGFHDFLCGYLSGHQMRLKLSSKDSVLLTHLLQKLSEWDNAISEQVQLTDNLRNCDAYIATGSNNTARYFEQYFGKYPHVIRRNRTSVAVLDGTESKEELAALAEDVFLYFGLGCRNVTQICVPKDYDFQSLFAAFEPYKDLIHHNKYRNNYDYYLAIYLLNKVPYLSNDAMLMVENESPFSAVAVLHYRYYDDKVALLKELKQNQDLQCIVAKEETPFGAAQVPSLSDYADGVDTMAFLTSL